MRLRDAVKAIGWRRAVITAVLLASAVVMLAVSMQNAFVDEYDNLLGAKVIVEGGFIYTDYFTQHMPLTYFLTSPFVLVFGTRLLWIRMAFTLVLVVWTLLIARRISRGAGAWYAAAFAAFVAVTYSMAWSNTLMAETWTAWCVAHVVVLFWLRKRESTPFLRSILVMLVLASIPVLSAAAYLPVSVALYGMVAWWMLERRADLTPWRWVAAAGVAVAPYAVVIGVLALHGAVGEAYFQAIRFNTDYYAQFNPGSPSGPVDGVLTVLQIFFNGMWNALTDFGLANQPIPLLLTLATLASLAWLWARQRWVLAGWLTVMVVFSGSRGVWADPQEGFGALLADNATARHAASLLMVIILLGVIVAEDMHRALPSPTSFAAKLRRPVQIAVATAAAAAVIVSLGTTFTQMRNALRFENTLAIQSHDRSASGVVNLINDGTDGTYWMAPAEYDHQLFVTSPPASRFGYFFDHVAACAECFDEVVSDLKSQQPRVMWFHPGSPYGPNALARLEAEIGDDYFTLDDPTLEGFLFLKADRADIVDRLRAAGFDV